MPRPASKVALTLACVSAFAAGSASALVVPLPGWVPVQGDASLWQDAAGACLIREDKYGQAFPLLTSKQQATATANRLRTTLSAGGLTEVVTQPVQRGSGVWNVLASYAYQEGGVTYRVSQLFMSQSGILRTVSGSSAVNNGTPCTSAMREFIRYGVN